MWTCRISSVPRLRCEKGDFVMLSKWKLVSAVAAFSLGIAASAVNAAPDFDHPAGLVIFPTILVDGDNGIDTRLHLSNTSNDQQMVHCFYVNANSHCSNTGAVCESFMDCVDDGVYGSCDPGWIETNFDIFFTSRQPIGWVASEGVSADDLPCRATFFDPNPCAGNGNNSGTRVPGISEDPFIGELKCIQADPITRIPVACGTGGVDCLNSFTGHAALTSVGTSDVASYRAVGLEQVANNGDRTLVVGGVAGGDSEYEPCADTLVMDFVYDGAIDPISGVLQASSELTLVPCTQDFRGQTTQPVVAQFLVYNEFEQRLSTSAQVDCLLNTPISLIGTNDPLRSIFSVNIGGTIMGQARIRGVGGGLAGVATLGLSDTFPIDERNQLLGWGGYALDTVAETEDFNPDHIYLP